jgi:hypothetical protein
LRERAVSDPRAAETLLGWLQRARADERVGGVDLESMSERELERLYAGLVRLASMDEEPLPTRTAPAPEWVCNAAGVPFLGGSASGSWIVNTDPTVPLWTDVAVATMPEEFAPFAPGEL